LIKFNIINELLSVGFLWLVLGILTITGIIKIAGDFIMVKLTKTDRTLELEGAEMEYDDKFGNIYHLKVARSTNNPHYETSLTKYMKPYRKAMKAGKDMTPEQAKNITIKTYAESILLGWDESEIEDDDGKPFQYSTENAIELLQDGDLRGEVADFSEDVTNFLKQKS